MVDARKVAAALVVISHYKRKQHKERKHRWWIKEIYRQRNVHTKQLLSDMTFEGVEETIKNFTRMNSETFEDLCIKLEPIIGKKDTSFRKAITTKERLAITLRFLASGDSFVSLQYLFRVSKQSISKIVRETCDALVKVLKEYVQTIEPIPSTSSQASQPPSISQLLSLELEFNIEGSQPPQPTSPLPVSQETSNSRPFSQHTRNRPLPRRRQSAVGTDSRSRLIQFEEERAERETVRNTELASSRAALLQLCGLIKEYLDRKTTKSYQTLLFLSRYLIFVSK